MAYYKKSDIDNVRNQADIRDFIPDLQGRGASRYRTCPECGKSGKDRGLIATHKGKINMAKCFSCGFTLKNSIEAEQYFGHCEFTEAVERVARQVGIPLEDETKRRERLLAEERARQSVESFCQRQLKESGLEPEDVKALVRKPGTDNTCVYVYPFFKGVVTPAGGVDPTGDDMLIQYYDLFGDPVKYDTKSKRLNYIRIRWRLPEEHQVGGKSVKYMTPKGAPCRFYIPEKIRRMFLQSQQFDTLIIQEGEKKAEKACKHGIPSIGIQGIWNIGNESSGLMSDLKYLVERCRIKNIVMMMDSDWDDLSHNLETGSNVDQRPLSFAGAVIKFKQYAKSLHDSNLNVDTWWGHINHNENNDKGIDDLLCNTLKGNEMELAEDIERAMNTHNGQSTYVDIHKISSMSDLKIRDFWGLNSRDAFFAKYAARLKGLGLIRFGGIRYRETETGEYTQDVISDGVAQFWEIETNENGKSKVEIDMKNAIMFLDSNGFRIIHTRDMEKGGYGFAKITDNVMSDSTPREIRNFVREYIDHTTKNKLAIDTFYKKIGSWFNTDRLEFIKFMDYPEKERSDIYETFFFRNVQCKVTSAGVETFPRLDLVPESRVINRKVTWHKIFQTVRRNESGTFFISLTPDGRSCEYLKFLINASNIMKKDIPKMRDEEKFDLNRNLINKLTAIGYLIVGWKNPVERKAVVAMDHVESEIGDNKGRSGKSLIGTALSQFLNTAFIDGRQLKNDDEFMFNDVTFQTELVHIDDVRVNFDIQNLFAAITNDMTVNPKGKARFNIPGNLSPKIYITTNHAIQNTDDSSMARLVFMQFGDWYNSNYSPLQEFGHPFFDGWDDLQWDLFYSLMMECVSLYYRSIDLNWAQHPGWGVVEPPMNDIERRVLRQTMGEAFLQWAQAYFDKSGPALNQRILRKDMFDNFQKEYPGNMKYVTSTNFKRRLIAYCKYSGLHFNPHRPAEKNGQTFEYFKGKTFVGQPDKSNSREYFMISDGSNVKPGIINPEQDEDNDKDGLPF